VDVGLAGSVSIRECPYTFRKLMDAYLRQKAFGLGDVVVVHGKTSFAMFDIPSANGSVGGINPISDEHKRG
jgi:hypothetical protein